MIIEIYNGKCSQFVRICSYVFLFSHLYFELYILFCHFSTVLSSSCISYAFMCKIAVFPCDMMTRMRSNLDWSNMDFFHIYFVRRLFSFASHLSFRIWCRYESQLVALLQAHETKGLDEHEKLKIKQAFSLLILLLLLLKVWN